MIESWPTQQEKGEAFRALHQGDPFVIPNPWDAGTAKVLAGLGFKALATTSGGFAFTLGRPDGSVTLDEVAAHVTAVNDATDLPVSVDLENGYGPAPEDAARAIARAAEAGAVGGSIEDWDRDDEQALRARTRRRARRGRRRGRQGARLPLHPDCARREPPAGQPGSRRHDRPAARLRGGGCRRPLRPGAAQRRRHQGRLRRRLEAGQRPRLLPTGPDLRRDRRGRRTARQRRQRAHLGGDERPDRGGRADHRQRRLLRHGRPGPCQGLALARALEGLRA